MDSKYRKKLVPAELNWVLLNNLEKFNDKPDLIKELYTKIIKLKENSIFGMFVDYYEEIYVNYFDKHNSFPDIAWLDANFKTNTLKVLDNPFSMTIYNDLIKIMDKEILKLETEEVLDKEDFSMDDIRMIATKMTRFADTDTEEVDVSKLYLKNLYVEYKKNYTGVKTYMENLDNCIGILGHKSLSVFAAPTGHGKSTFAMSVAYNAAIYGGLCIDYLSYELTIDQIWFNLASMESYILGINIEASRIKERALTKEEEEAFDICMDSLFKKLNISGGFINVIDHTTVNSNTFDGLCARLESIAEERKRKADLIVIDNVDNLKILKNSERDESTRVNNYIVSLDGYCKKYYNGEGTSILLLSQVNRPALKKLQGTESEKSSEDKKIKVDVSCIQQYNALYEKAVCCLIGYSDEKMRSINRMNVIPVKLRNRPIPLEPIQLPVNFAYSRIGNDVVCMDTDINQIEDIISAKDVDDELEDIL